MSTQRDRDRNAADAAACAQNMPRVWPEPVSPVTTVPVKITVYREGGALVVTVTQFDRERFVMSTPTGDRAAYPEAVARGLAEAYEKVGACVAQYVSLYPDAEVVDRTSEWAV